MSFINKFIAHTVRLSKIFFIFMHSLPIQALCVRKKIAGKVLVVWELSDIHFLQHLEPIISSLLDRDIENVSFLFIASIDENKGLKKYQSKVIFSSVPARYLIFGDFYITASNFRRGPWKAYSIHVGHSVGGRKYVTYPRGDYEYFDEWFLQGPLRRAQIEWALQKFNIRKRPILTDVGYPISDQLYDFSCDQNVIKSHLGLSKNRKVVVFAPSWNAEGALRWNDIGVKIIECLLLQEEIDIIVRLHPMSYLSEKHPNYIKFTGGVDWRTRLSCFNSKVNFFHYDDGSQGNASILSVADLLITDFSTIALDFIPLLRPIIFVQCPDFIPKAFFGKTDDLVSGKIDNAIIEEFELLNLGYDCGPVIGDIENINLHVKWLLSNPHFYESKQKKAASKILYNKGESTSFAVNRLVEVISHCKNSSI